MTWQLVKDEEENDSKQKRTGFQIQVTRPGGSLSSEQRRRSGERGGAIGKQFGFRHNEFKEAGHPG